jgi:hypothetical protein
VAVLGVTMTRPQCGRVATETMPLDRCVVVYECPACHITMTPEAVDCWVFCTYGDGRYPLGQDARPCQG